jgi:Spy/CpxP family protein refolding chaperone
MKRKMVFGFIAACSLVLNVAFVTMWLTHAGPRFLMAHRMCGAKQMDCQQCPLHKTLALSDSQWGVLKPRVEAYRQGADSLQCEIAAAREALLVELARTPTDTAALAACRGRILDGQRRMQERVVLTVLEQKKVLTPEQQKRFIETMRSSMACERGLGMIGATGMMHQKSEGDRGHCGR